MHPFVSNPSLFGVKSLIAVHAPAGNTFRVQHEDSVIFIDLHFCQRNIHYAVREIPKDKLIVQPDLPCGFIPLTHVTVIRWSGCIPACMLAPL